MTGYQYLILAYVVGFGLLLGYAAKMWLDHRGLRKTDRDEFE